MNPTELFISELKDSLRRHEAATGAYIEDINIDRVPMQKAGEVRAERVIVKIQVSMK